MHCKRANFRLFISHYQWFYDNKSDTGMHILTREMHTYSLLLNNESTALYTYTFCLLVWLYSELRVFWSSAVPPIPNKYSVIIQRFIYSFKSKWCSPFPSDADLQQNDLERYQIIGAMLTCSYHTNALFSCPSLINWCELATSAFFINPFLVCVGV